MKICTAQEMKAAERQAVEHGSSYEELMERAGQGAAKKLLALFPNEKKNAAHFMRQGE